MMPINSEQMDMIITDFSIVNLLFEIFLDTRDRWHLIMAWTIWIHGKRKEKKEKIELYAEEKKNEETQLGNWN